MSGFECGMTKSGPNVSNMALRAIGNPPGVALRDACTLYDGIGRFVPARQLRHSPQRHSPRLLYPEMARMMIKAIVEERVEQLCSSPAGCVLLLKVVAGELTPEQVVDPVIGMLLVSSAVGEITPWRQDHDWLVERALAGGSKRRDLARAIITQPGIEQWWTPLRRDAQMWIQPGPDKPFPAPVSFPTPRRAPNGWEIYAQSPEHRISTSTRIDGWTSQLADTVAYMNGSDWIIQYPPVARSRSAMMHGFSKSSLLRIGIHSRSRIPPPAIQCTRLCPMPCSGTHRGDRTTGSCRTGWRSPGNGTEFMSRCGPS